MRKRHLILTVIVITTGLFLSGCSNDGGSAGFAGSDLAIMNAKIFTSDAPKSLGTGCFRQKRADNLCGG